VKLTVPLPTDVEKFRAIYTWTCLNIANDYVLFDKNRRMREKFKNNPEELKSWNKGFSRTVFETLRKKKRTVCTGYAYLLRELASHVGISCVIVDGYGRNAIANISGSGSVNHSWTAVHLDNKWYLCDATWSSGAMDMEQKDFVKNYDDCYFLLDPSLFIRNHYPLDSTWMLLDDKPTLQEFLNRPLVYQSFFQYKIKHVVPETFEVTATKRQPVSFQFTRDDNAPIEKIELSIKSPGTVYKAYPELHTDVPGGFSFTHTFSSKGMHTVHVLLDNRYVFTYTVKVI
jgi:transglutaminase/protease-like cytokinesis protein 3